MLPRPSEFPRPARDPELFPNPYPTPNPELMALCIEKMADYMRLAENQQADSPRFERSLKLAEGYAEVYRALKS